MSTLNAVGSLGFRPIGLFAGVAMVMTANPTVSQAFPVREARLENSKPLKADPYDYRGDDRLLPLTAQRAFYREILPDADAWLTQTMQTIEYGRKAGILSNAVLQQVEALIADFACLPRDRRPILMFDDDGIANFATASNGLYFHLTINRPSEISWILESGESEDEAEGEAFDGKRLPTQLMALLAR